MGERDPIERSETGLPPDDFKITFQEKIGSVANNKQEFFSPTINGVVTKRKKFFLSDRSTLEGKPKRKFAYDFVDLEGILKNGLICDKCNTYSFELTKTSEGAFGVGFDHLVECIICSGKLIIQEDPFEY